MPKIKIEKVLTFSTEDPHHPALNILNADPGRKWKCAHTGEKMASVVLQLEKAMQITGIDIGNENSAYIEVLVSRSSSDEFRPLLGMSAFMSPLEARNHQNINKVRMFTSSDFSQPEGTEKWDRVKIVCIQPYNKHVQYGLSFVTIQTNEGSLTDGKKNVNRFTLRPDSPTPFSVGSLFQEEREKMYAAPSTSLKGAAAIREASSKPSQSSYKSPIIKKMATASPKPSTSKDADPLNDGEETNRNRNRNRLLYDNDDEAPNDKIDRLIEKKKQEDAEKAAKQKLKQEDQKKLRTPKKTPRTGDGGNETKKRKTDTSSTTLGSETPTSPKKRRTSDVLKDLNASSTVTAKAGPSSSPLRVKHKRTSSDSTHSENCSPRKQKKIRDKLHTTKLYEKLLEGVVFVISGVQNPERANLRTTALAMGARYKADWDGTCTHLICAFANTPKFNQVRGQGKIVKKQWIIECDKQRKRLPWRRFCLDKRDITGNESEEEIWEQVEVSDDSNEVEDEQVDQDTCDTDDEIERIQVKQQQHSNATPTTNNDINEPMLKNSRTTRGNKVSNMTINCKFEEVNTVKNGKDKCEKMNVEDLPVLPNYFSGLTFYLSKNLDVLLKELTQYIIAYDGKIVDAYGDIDDTVLAITYSDDAEEVHELRKHADRLISPTWLLECHNKKRLLPFDDFLI